MVGFSGWGDPYQDQVPEVFEIGDKARVKSFVPYSGGRTGTVVDLEYGCTLEFEDGTKHTYDEDMLVKVKPQENEK